MKKMWSVVILLLLLFLLSCESGSSVDEVYPNLPSNFDLDNPVPVPLEHKTVTVPAMVNVPVDDIRPGAEGFSVIPSMSSYKMSMYETTYEMWFVVKYWAERNGYTFSHDGTEGGMGIPGDYPSVASKQPVTTISWRDIIVWCNAYNEYCGLDFVYFKDSGFTVPVKSCTSDEVLKVDPGDEDNPYVKWTANGYRLPTLAQWQSTARYIDGIAWTQGTHVSSSTIQLTGATMNDETIISYAWNRDYSVPVGTRPGRFAKANNLGVYDMSGNVSEILWDWKGAITNASPFTDTDSKGASTGTLRTIAGGNAYEALYYQNLWVSMPGTTRPWSAIFKIGFRTVKPL